MQSFLNVRREDGTAGRVAVVWSDSDRSGHDRRDDSAPGCGNVGGSIDSGVSRRDGEPNRRFTRRLALCEWAGSPAGAIELTVFRAQEYFARAACRDYDQPQHGAQERLERRRQELHHSERSPATER